jgi:hypothetical protein
MAETDPMFTLARFKLLAQDRTLPLGDRAVATYYASHLEDSLHWFGRDETGIDYVGPDDDGLLPGNCDMRPAGAAIIQQVKIRARGEKRFILLIGQGDELRLKAVIRHEANDSMTNVARDDEDYCSMERLHEGEHLPRYRQPNSA